MSNVEDLPEIVYHYTSMDTLLKIVENNELWSTNIRYLNDVSERQHYLDLIKNRAKHRCNEDTSTTELFEATFYEENESKSFTDLPFVTSFSSLEDSLPQWRSYCPNGNGVSIGFRTDVLRKAQVKGLLKITGKDVWSLTPYTSFGKVRYLEPDDLTTVDEMINKAIENASKDQEENNKEGYGSPTMDQLLWYEFDKNATLIKHPSFKEENEFRLTSRVWFGMGTYLHFRSSRSTLVPFVKMDVPFPDQSYRRMSNVDFNDSKPHYIQSVIVGPTPNKDLSADAVQHLFLAKGYKIEVRNSVAPFRDL